MTSYNDLINCLKSLKKVGFGDYVEASSWNNLINCIKIARDLIEIAQPCPGLDNAITKLYNVYNGQIIQPNDVITKQNAIKEARDCLSNLNNVTQLDSIIATFRTPVKGQPVLASDYNSILDALNQIAKLLTFTITVTVIDKATGNPVSGATVTVSYNSTQITKTTDISGVAVFTGIPIGVYATITATKTGYTTYETTVYITGNVSITAEIAKPLTFTFDDGTLQGWVGGQGNAPIVSASCAYEGAYGVLLDNAELQITIDLTPYSTWQWYAKPIQYDADGDAFWYGIISGSTYLIGYWIESTQAPLGVWKLWQQDVSGINGTVTLKYSCYYPWTPTMICCFDYIQLIP